MDFMIEIIPAIIAKDFAELKKKIELVEPYVSWAQLDVMDGRFAPEISWNNPDDLKKIKTNLNLEAHLMVFEPEAEIEKWISSGVKRILVHFESTKILAEIIEKIKNASIEAGAVLNLETEIGVIDEFMKKINLVQLMAIEKIGYHGHAFDQKVIPKISALRANYPDVKIAVDGGINKNTAKKAILAGADILVAGSAVFESQNIEASIKDLKD